MTPLTDGGQTYYDAATVCGECGIAFTAANHKAAVNATHDHVSGQYLFTARPKKTTDNDHDANNHIDIDADETVNDGEEIQMAYGDIRVTPLNGEKYLSFHVGNLRFIDSFQFLSTSLANLVSLLLKSGRDNFAHTIKRLGNHDLIFAKGVYPYSYITGPEKFGEPNSRPSKPSTTHWMIKPAPEKITIAHSKFGLTTT